MGCMDIEADEVRVSGVRALAAHALNSIAQMPSENVSPQMLAVMVEGAVSRTLTDIHADVKSDLHKLMGELVASTGKGEG